MQAADTTPVGLPAQRMVNSLSLVQRVLILESTFHAIIFPMSHGGSFFFLDLDVVTYIQIHVIQMAIQNVQEHRCQLPSAERYGFYCRTRSSAGRRHGLFCRQRAICGTHQEVRLPGRDVQLFWICRPVLGEHQEREGTPSFRGYWCNVRTARMLATQWNWGPTARRAVSHP